MKPPSSGSQAFDAACSAWLGRRVDTIPYGLHGLLSNFRYSDEDSASRTSRRQSVRRHHTCFHVSSVRFAELLALRISGPRSYGLLLMRLAALCPLSVSRQSTARKAQRGIRADSVRLEAQIATPRRLQYQDRRRCTRVNRQHEAADKASAPPRSRRAPAILFHPALAHRARAATIASASPPTAARGNVSRWSWDRRRR
jgi:hypothetical protein